MTKTTMLFRLEKSLIGVAMFAALIFVTPSWAQNGNQNAQLLLELQSLRQELAELRNQVEQQGYQLRQLKKTAPGSANTQQVNPNSSISSVVGQRQESSETTFPAIQVAPTGEISSGALNQGQVQPNTQGEITGPNSAAGGVNFPLTPENGNVSLRPVNPAVNSQQGSQVFNSTSQPAQIDSVPQGSGSRQQGILENGNRGIQTNLNELELYNKGIAKLNSQEYKAAASIFSAQLQNFPKGEKAADAYFWLAETFYILGDLDSSTKSYQSLVTLFPQHSRAPKALIKLVGVEQERGRDDMAKIALNNLLRNYANSNEASLAKTKYSALL